VSSLPQLMVEKLCFGGKCRREFGETTGNVTRGVNDRQQENHLWLKVTDQ
jgi:hypothetical protein